MTSFGQAWKHHYGDLVPFGHVLRKARPSLRFFGLPEGKRYATSEVEHTEILTRAHAIARQLFAPRQEIWRVHCVHIATRCERAEALPRVGEVIEPMSEERFHVHALAEPFDGHAHDALLRDIADDVIAYVLFFDATRGTVFAPYDGGFDVIFAEASAHEAMRSFEPTWSRLK